jgi:hypothetical protein
MKDEKRHGARGEIFVGLLGILVYVTGCGMLVETTSRVVVEISMEPQSVERARWVSVQIFSDSDSSREDEPIALRNDGLWRICDAESEGSTHCVSDSMMAGDPLVYTITPLVNRVRSRFRIVAELYDSDSIPTRGISRPFSRIEARALLTDGEARRLPLRFDDACADAPPTSKGFTCWAGETRGSCFATLPFSAEELVFAEPQCSECETCGGVACEPRPAGSACGCAGDECDDSGWCRVKSPVRRLASGLAHTCVSFLRGRAYDSNDRESLYCWGSNEHGATGHTLELMEPESFCPDSTCADVGSLTTGGYAEGASGSLSCGIVRGQLRCWGSYGQRLAEDLAHEAPGDALWKVVRAGGGHICALTTESRLYCWGANGGGSVIRGQVGSGSPESYVYTPELVAGDHRWERFSTGRYHTCGITQQGTLYCWGYNADGELGTGSFAHSNVPRRVLISDSPEESQRWSSVSAGGFQTCALDDQHRVWCWGGNQAHNLGRGGDNQDSARAALVSTDERFDAVDCGRSHCCAISQADASLHCWGRNTAGQVGLTRSSLETDDHRLSVNRPTRLNAGGGWDSLSLGEEHSCASRQDGSLFCWGSNEWGQLGVGGGAVRTSPTRVCLPEGT